MADSLSAGPVSATKDISSDLEPIPSSASPTTTTNTTSAPEHNHDHDSDSDLSALLEDDTDSPALAALQQARLSELQAAATATANLNSASTHTPFSHLQPYTSEKAAMHTIAASALSILLFTHPSFPLCKVMAAHLDRIAGLTAAAGAGGNVEVENVTWINLEAERAPFLTEKLRIRVLPAVVGYRSGEECGRLVGFEGMPGRAAREAGWKIVVGVLRQWGVVGKERLMGEDEGSEDEDEDEDEDAEDGGRRDGGRHGNWIGGQKSNSKFSTRGTGRGPRDEDDDDEWE